MTKFVKDQFNMSGEYMTYGADRRFVARFKYFKSDKARFRAFLIKNFTVEEYFGLLESGGAPLTILEAKGYLGGGKRSICQKYGFPLTQAGYEQARAARRAAMVA